MRNNKKIFWISFISGIISIGLIILFHWLSTEYIDQKDIFNATENIFISLIGGAFLSSVTSYIAYYNTKRKNIVDFLSNYITITNKIKHLHNLIEWHYEDIKYVDYKDSKSNLTDEQQKIYDQNNNKYIQMFYKAIHEIEVYNYNRIYEVLDDYTGFWIWNKNPKVRVQMKIMIDEVNKYHILRKKCRLDYMLFEQEDYDNYIFYTNVIKDYYKTCKDVTMEHLCEEYQILLKISKINDYLKSIYKGLVPIENSKGKNK